MVAIGVLVSDPASLTQRRVLVHATVSVHAVLHICGVVLAGYQQYALMETTDHWDLRRLLWRLLWLLLWVSCTVF